MKANWALGVFFFSSFSVVAQPVITAQPTNQVANVGSVATFTVSVSSATPLSYQWQFNGINLPLGGIITTVAGSAVCCITSGDNGDGGIATNAALATPNAVAVDAQGKLFISNQGTLTIRKVDTNGIITTVAGSGALNTFSGDGGAATSAGLASPTGVALDTLGNLFIADGNNNRIRKVATNGIISTVAGNGDASFYGDNTAATNAALNYPRSVAVDTRGNLFIADYNNYRIRRVDTNGIITTVAGNGTNSFSGDGDAATNATFGLTTGVAVDTQGNLFIVDGNNARIRQVDANGIIRTVAGNGTFSFSGDGGAATSAELSTLSGGVAVDVAGNLFITASH